MQDPSELKGQMEIPYGHEGQFSPDLILMVTQLERYQRDRHAAQARLEKLTDAMSRKSSRVWAPRKTAKYARRLMEAQRLVKNYDQMIQQINSRLGESSQSVTGR